MKCTVSRIGCAAACMALCLALGCSCSVLPPASGKPAAAAPSVPTDKNGNLLYDSSRLDDGRLRMLYGYDSSGNSCTVLCGGKVLYQSLRSENVSLTGSAPGPIRMPGVGAAAACSTKAAVK